MADLIERDAAIWITAETGALETQRRIKELHAANRWIPCSERLPEKAGEYLVTYHPCYWDDVSWDTVRVGIDTFRGKTTWAKKKYQRVIAWMPMPDAYEPQKERYTV